MSSSDVGKSKKKKNNNKTKKEGDHKVQVNN